MAKLSLLPAERPAIGTAVDAEMQIRSVLFAAVFLLLWFSFHPFRSLAESPEVAEAGDRLNQIGFSAVFLLLAGWSLIHEPSRLRLLLRPILIVTLLWCTLCVVTSWDPSLSARRFAFTLVTIGIGGMVLLLPQNLRHFSDLMAAVALIVLAACYLGVVLAPALAIHQPTDFAEPELAGDWRGVFIHKNSAGAAMVLFIFIGLFVARMRSVGLGGVIAATALTFLVFTQSKTSMALLPLAFILAAVVARIRRPVLAIALVVLVLVFFNVFSVGSVYFEGVRDLIDQILPDPTFTGRTDVWRFALDHVAQHPLTGYGFSAFWGTERVVYGLGNDTLWANFAGHAHNSYVNLALTIGIPGALLVTVWLVVLPLADYYRSPSEHSTAPLKMLFLRVCLFAACQACFENTFFGTDGFWLFLLAATFGLRFLAVSRVTM